MSRELIVSLPEAVHALQYVFQKLTPEQWKYLFSVSHNSPSTSPSEDVMYRATYGGLQLDGDGLLLVDVTVGEGERWVLHTTLSKILESIKEGKI